MMIVSSFIDRLGELVSLLFQRHWVEWEIITIAVIVVFVLLWIIRQQRKRAFRNIYDNQFLESTPVIGTKLGSRKRRRHLIKDFKKAQLAAAQQGHKNQQKSTKQAESKKLHEQIRQLQREIIKHKKSEVSLEEKVVYLTSVNKKLEYELAELKQAGQQVDQEQVTDKKEQPVIPESVQVGQDIREPKVEVSAEDEHVERKPPRKSKTYEDLHRVVDDVKQKLCRKCNEWKPESEFHKNASSKDGLAGSCKACKAAAAKEYRKRRKTAQG